jgi:hypothetical protein
MAYKKGDTKVWNICGKDHELEYVGRINTGVVWKGQDEQDPTKSVTVLIGHDDALDALASFGSAQDFDHLPNVRGWGHLNTDVNDERKVYTFPWAEKISAIHNAWAWAQMKALGRLMAEAEKQIRAEQKFAPKGWKSWGERGWYSQVGLFICERLIDLAKAEGLDTHLIDSLEELVYAMSIWGSDCYLLFRPSRVKVDAEGRLILQNVGLIPSRF